MIACRLSARVVLAADEVLHSLSQGQVAYCECVLGALSGYLAAWGGRDLVPWTDPKALVFGSSLSYLSTLASLSVRSECWLCHLGFRRKWDNVKVVDKLSGITQMLSVTVGVHIKPHPACDAGPAVDRCQMIVVSLGPAPWPWMPFAGCTCPVPSLTPVPPLSMVTSWENSPPSALFCPLPLRRTTLRLTCACALLNWRETGWGVVCELLLLMWVTEDWVNFSLFTSQNFCKHVYIRSI